MTLERGIKIPSAPTVPAIYKLIEKRADCQTIVQQLYADFYSPEPDLEKVFLAIDELQKRGNEGEAALSNLAKGTDDLGKLIRTIQKNQIKEMELETFLGINRFNNVIPDESEEDRFKRAYEHAKKNGYTHMSYAECVDYTRRLSRRTSGLPSHLDGRTDKEIFAISATFGSDEPGYMELLGPREILRLRSLSKPSFLLLGSYGVYSSREFRAFTNKINPANKSFVIDIDDESIKRLANDRVNDGTLVQGDARRLPFEDDTLDQIYTNRIFDFLGSGEFFSDINQDIKNLMSESFRALKPGGSLVLLENAGADRNTPRVNWEITQVIIQMARRAGFILAKNTQNHLSFILRPETSFATIDNNGFPQYGNSLLGEHEPFDPFGLRLVKQK